MEEALGLAPKSEMQQNATVTPAKLSAFERAQKFIDGLKQGKSVVFLAQELEVDRATLYRDFDEWLKTSGPAELYVEWLRDSEELKKLKPEKVLECKTRLLCKILEKQAKVEVNVTNQTAVSVSECTQDLSLRERLVKQYMRSRLEGVSAEG